MSNEIAKFNEQEMTLIEQLGYKQIPANHLKMFFARAEALGLNPQDPSQIALIERKTKNGKTTPSKSVSAEHVEQLDVSLSRRAAPTAKATGCIRESTSPQGRRQNGATRGTWPAWGIRSSPRSLCTETVNHSRMSLLGMSPSKLGAEKET